MFVHSSCLSLPNTYILIISVNPHPVIRMEYTSYVCSRLAVYTRELYFHIGDEYGFVVLSTVRSQPIDEISNPDHVQPDYVWLRESLGFVTDEHQINVGITRSKYGLVIVGESRLLEAHYTS